MTAACWKGLQMGRFVDVKRPRLAHGALGRAKREGIPRWGVLIMSASLVAEWDFRRRFPACALP